MDKCWKCLAAPGDLPERVPFRATCDACGAYLHVCKACVNYQVGQPNDCRIPDTDPIRDREMANFCEYFKPGREQEEDKSAEAKKRFDDLFG